MRSRGYNTNYKDTGSPITPGMTEERKKETLAEAAVECCVNTGEEGPVPLHH